MATPPIYVTFLNRLDIEALALTDDEILDGDRGELAAQGRGEAVIEPRVHLEPGVARGHFNVLRGASKPPIDRAGREGRRRLRRQLHAAGCPRSSRVLLLFDPRTGVPQAILDASGITDMRTGAVTAIGAKYLARKDSKVLGHVGARGTAYWNVRLLDHLFGFDEIRVHSRRPESRDAFAAAPLARPRQAGDRDRGLARLRRGRRHRRRGLAARRADADAEDDVDQAGRASSCPTAP